MQKTAFRPYETVRGSRLQLGENPAYFMFASRETCLARDFWIYWFADRGCKGFLDVPHRNTYEYFIEEASSLAFLRGYAAELQENWERHLAGYEPAKRGLLNASAELASSCEKNDGAGILDSYRRYCKEAYDYSAYIWSPWAVIYGIEGGVMQSFPKDISVIASLDQPIQFMEMKADLPRLSPRQLEEKWAWLNVYSPFDPPFTQADFWRMKAESDAGEAEEDARRRGENRERFSAFIDAVGDTALRRKAEIVHRYAFLKTDRIDAWKKSMFFLRPFFSFLASVRKGFTMTDACNLSPAETISLLGRGEAPSLEGVRRRSANKALYFFSEGVLRVVEDEPEVLRVRKLVEKPAGLASVAGQTACGGTAVGTAKVVLHSSDLPKVADGDVFVAKYTFPTFTPYMRKCRAVLTDDGGITSHAAIISREYGIPCIVGTRHATKTFKDGDVVEVDASNGIARKIS